MSAITSSAPGRSSRPAGIRGIGDRVAGAPITWGVCEVPGWGHQLEPRRVLAEMSGLGLRATELGPEGFLPNDPSRLRDFLAVYGLDLVGGFLPVVLHASEGLEDRVEHVDLKDVAAGWAERVRSGAITYSDAVRGGMYRPLGTGDVDVAAIVRTLHASGYRGWFVLEQDTALESDPAEGTGPVRD